MSETATGGDRRESIAIGTSGKSSKGKLIVFGLLGLLLLGGGTVAFLERGKLFHSVRSGVTENSKRAQSALHPPVMLGIPPIVSNLDSGDGRPVYVKLTAKVEITGAEGEAALQSKVPQIQDIFQTYLHETRPQDIRGNGIYRLREAILRRLRADMAPLQVTNLYLVEFLVQ